MQASEVKTVGNLYNKKIDPACIIIKRSIMKNYGKQEIIIWYIVLNYSCIIYQTTKPIENPYIQGKEYAT